MESAFSAVSFLLLMGLFPSPARADTVTVTGEVVDADTGAPLACRVYIRGTDGQWHFARSAGAAGSAVTYQKQNRNNKESVEMHTTLSAHGFAVDLPPGEYEITVERGKEYFPVTKTATVGTEPMTLRFKLKRWIDMAELGWYSGDTHVHRTQFAFTKFGEAPAAYMDVDTDEKGFTERGWIEYGFQNYYALLNCGFRLRPTAGTASGVHPVPLGYGRVYVKLEGGFDYDAWMEGLDEGRSFVTTGPMLFAKVNGFLPGHIFQQSGEHAPAYSVAGSVRSAHPLESIEIVVNGEVSRAVRPQNKPMESGAFLNRIDEDISVTTSSWLAVRCFEKTPGNRVRFAHTGPFHVEVPGRPLHPRREEIEFLIRRVEKEIERNKEVLPPEAIEEYRRALDAYRKIAASSR